MNKSSKNRRHMNTNYIFKHNFVYCSVTQTIYFFYYLTFTAEYKIHPLLKLQAVCTDLLTTCFNLVPSPSSEVHTFSQINTTFVYLSCLFWTK